jgi:glycosyl transferase family 1
MRILLCSHFFHPSVGGIEQVSQLLAHEFTLAGHTVKVVTSTAESVVPSRCQEPFGLVALEGVACGCRAIVVADGGLAEAIGGLAVIFERASAA